MQRIDGIFIANVISGPINPIYNWTASIHRVLVSLARGWWCLVGLYVCTVFVVFVFVFVLLNCSCTYNRVHTQGAWLVAVHIRHGEWHTAPRAQIHLLSRKHFAFWQKFHLLPDLLARLPNLIFGEGDFQALLVGESCYCQRGAGGSVTPEEVAIP